MDKDKKQIDIKEFELDLNELFKSADDKLSEKKKVKVEPAVEKKKIKSISKKKTNENIKEPIKENTNFYKMIESYEFENGLNDLFTSVSAVSIEEKKIIKKNVIKEIKKENKIKELKKKKTLVSEAEKFVPNKLNKNEIGVDLSKLISKLKDDPDFIGKLKNTQSYYGGAGSGVGVAEAQSLVDVGISTLNNIGDVEVTSVIDGQVLFWCAANNEWRSKTVSAAGGNQVAIDSLSTPNYIGANSNDGVLRVSGDEIIYTDGGDYVTIGINQSSISASQITNDEFATQSNLLTVSGDVNTNTSNIATLSGDNTFDTVQFNTNFTSASNPAWNEGLLFYDYENKCPAYYTDQPDVTVQINREGQIRIFNETGSTIVNGTPVAILSAVGVGSSATPTIELAKSEVSISHIIGVATHDILDNNYGLATQYGTVSDVNLTAYNVGDDLYLSTSAGILQNEPLLSPYSNIEVGHVIENSVNGKFLVSINHKQLLSLNEKILWVSTSGLDTIGIDGTKLKPYKTLKYALNQITDNSPMNKYIIQLEPGVYQEDNPIQLKGYVAVQAVGIKETTTIQALNDDDVFIASAGNTQIKHIGFSGNLSNDKFSIVLTSAGNYRIEDVGFNNINGICTRDVGINLRCDTVTFNATSKDIYSGFCVSGGTVTIRNVDIIDNTRIGSIFRINNPESTVIIKDVNSFSSNVSACVNVGTSANCILNSIDFANQIDGIIVGDGSIVRINSGVILSSQNNAITLTSGGSGQIVGMNAVTLQTSTNWDLDVIHPDSTLYGNGYLELNKVNIHETASVYGSFVDLFAGDEGVNILGELHVGTVHNPAESVFGEGDSYTGDMIVYTYDGTTSAIEDVSVSARSFVNSTFGFSNNVVDSAIYCASTSIRDGDYVDHYGIKAFILSAHNGTGKIITEYYTSAGIWEEINTMSSDSGGSYYTHADGLFENTESQQIRYDNTVKLNMLGKSDPVGYGTDLYWYRFRISSTTNAAPVFEQFKLHSSRLEINSDGWEEYFGRARPISRLSWEIVVLEKAATAPGDQDLYLGNTLDVGGKKNRLRDGEDDRVGFKSLLPFDCDTSTPIIFDWSTIVATGGGDLDYVIRWGFNSDGDNVYRAAPGSDPINMRTYTVTVPAPLAADTVKWYRTTLDISDMISRRESGFSDTIWLTIQRTGTADTNGSDASLVAIGANYTKWCNGGHI